MVVIAVVGRPNVGKSTLFNALCGKKVAIQHNRPGVTRDVREGEAVIAGRDVTLLDTAGLEEADPASLQGRMTRMTLGAIERADVALLVVDGKSGLTPADRHFAELIRRSNKPAVLAVNKCDADRGSAGYYDALSLGITPAVAVSAEHKLGFYDLHMALGDFFPEEPEEDAPDEIDAEGKVKPAGPLRVAVIGRPNAGKSTLLNTLLGKERTLTGPEAGITRDTIAVSWEHKGRPVHIADTAGIRRKANIQDQVEGLSVADALREVRFAHVVILLTDIASPFDNQDLALADLIAREGRCLITALTKSDTVTRAKAAEAVQENNYVLREKCARIPQVPLHLISAHKREGLDELVESCFEAYAKWNIRISTGKLNRWLQVAEAANHPPLGKRNRPIRLKYITQGNTRPPTFTLFVNYPDETPDNYKRYLSNRLAVDFGMGGVPMRLMLRKADNPYASKRGKRDSSDD